MNKRMFQEIVDMRGKHWTEKRARLLKKYAPEERDECIQMDIDNAQGRIDELNFIQYLLDGEMK